MAYLQKSECNARSLQLTLSTQLVKMLRVSLWSYCPCLIKRKQQRSARESTVSQNKTIFSPSEECMNLHSSSK